MKISFAIVLGLGLGDCGGGGDACQRAFDRLDRIAAARHEPSMQGAFRTAALDGCRHERTAQYDPVLRCALDSPSDAAAARCVDAIMRDVVKAPAPIEHVETCPGARATWRGERADDSDTYSTLTITADGMATPITIDVEDIPRANSSFAIFSPDCKRVLLLRSALGPYDIVRVDHLARYAAGEPPEFVLRGKPDPATGTGAGNLRDGAWVSNTEVDYSWGCCDPPIDERFVLPR